MRVRPVGPSVRLLAQPANQPHRMLHTVTCTLYTIHCTSYISPLPQSFVASSSGRQTAGSESSTRSNEHFIHTLPTHNTTNTERPNDRSNGNDTHSDEPHAPELQPSPSMGRPVVANDGHNDNDNDNDNVWSLW